MDRLKLLSKGWSASEVEHASKIFAEAEKNKHKTMRFLDTTTYWIILILLLGANMAAAVFLIPFLITIQNNFVTLIVAVVGFVFGVMLSILIIDIEKVQGKTTQLLTTMFLSGLVNVALMLYFTGDAISRVNVSFVHNAYVIGAIYLFAFLIPHIVYMYRERE
jgi:hypothetical protein